ncbi:lipase family protein [Corynebacterium flavescens]|uniref:lipase family protein n=1 Tax=Corynebacterium flavescens TaxID=28028 RepID=UPI003F91A200
MTLVTTGVWVWRPWRWRRPRFPRVALGIVVSIAAIGAVAATPQWRSTSFYEFHGEIPAAGTLLRVSSYPGTAPAGSTALRLLYATTRADGSPAVASAVAAIPDNAGSTAVAWQHGTTGVAQACAPSLRDNALKPEAIPAIAEMVSRGWNVVATDYPGQGTEGRFPYLIGQGEGRAALDSLRALRQLDQVPDGGKNMLWGHSQGGHATLFADQIAADYAPELEISGVAALSAAADPQLLAERILGTGANALGTMVGSFVLVPYAAEYPDVRLKDYMIPVATPLLRAAAQRCTDDKTILVSLLTTAALKTRGALVTADLNNSALGQRLRENTASGAGTAPLFLGQGVEDEVVPIAGQAEMAQRARLSGRAVTEKDYPGRSHMGVIAADSPLITDLLDWADAHVAS